MCTKLFWLAFIGIFLKLHLSFSDEDCQVPQRPKLQIIFVIDQVMKLKFDRYAQLHTSSAGHLFDLLKQNNFDVEYAVAGFVDYPDTAGPRGIIKEDVCYILFQELTTDRNKMVAAVGKDVFPTPGGKDTNHSNPGGYYQSLTTAMLFAAVDKNLKWSADFYHGGKLVRKIMILMVYNRFITILATPGNRKPPKADGKDTCANSLIPEMEQLNQVLFEHQFTLINSIVKVPQVGHSIEKFYADAFSSFFVPYYQAPLPKSGVYASGGMDTLPYAKNLYDTISKEVMSCDWEDPVGYNTLGL